MRWVHLSETTNSHLAALSFSLQQSKGRKQISFVKVGAGNKHRISHYFIWSFTLSSVWFFFAFSWSLLPLLICWWTWFMPKLSWCLFYSSGQHYQFHLSTCSASLPSGINHFPSWASFLFFRNLVVFFSFGCLVRNWYSYPTDFTFALLYKHIFCRCNSISSPDSLSTVIFG